MPTLQTLLLFSVACLALTATPGPDMLLITSRTVSQGRTAGFATLGGILLGTYCHALAAALGLAKLFVLVPAAYDTVRLLGAAYLLWLAVKSFRPGTSPSVSPEQEPPLSHQRIFLQGLLTNLLNPKMALFVLALFPQFLDPARGSVISQTLVLATELNLIGLLVNGGVILLASHLAERFHSTTRRARWPSWLLGSVFLALACRLALASKH